MDFFLEHQNLILDACAILCFFISVFILAIKQQSYRKKRALFIFEFAIGIFLVADVLTQQFDGDTSVKGYWINRVANFLDYFMIDFIIYSFNTYLVCQIVGRNKLKDTPKRVYICFAITGIAMAITVLSAFTGLYYYFDEFNVYHRTNIYPISFIFPFVTLVLQLSLVLQYRNLIDSRIRISFLVFTIGPMASAILQLYLEEISFLCLTAAIAAIIMFFCYIIEQNELLLESAGTEVMTGLPNAYGYQTKLEKIIVNRDIKKYDAFYLDIVRMGSINKKYGSNQGDLVIKLFAEYILNHIEKDEILGRLGGNFFVALIKKENAQNFLNMIGKVPVTIKMGNQTVNLIVSAVAGAYSIESNHVIAEQLIGYPSLAVNIAKNVLKKPYVYLTPELQAKIQEDRALEERIPVAMHNSEFVPFYQPKVNVATGELSGAEALVRWIHDGKVVPPMSFLPHMEQNDSICELDLYMLNRVCQDIVDWSRRGLRPPVISVNLSRRHLGNHHLVRDINDILNRYSLSPSCIQFEVTETIDEYGMDILKNVVAELRSYGFAVAIDDFGTGSSSIQLLNEVNFDVLKIDKSFVDSESERKKKILGYIVQIAKTVNSDVIAEGVETTDQLRYLYELGCKHIQGYIFDRPLNKKDFEMRLADKKYKIEM